MATIEHHKQTTTERAAPNLGTMAAIVVLGAIMTVLDATIVSVAIDTLADDFGSPLSTIQWVITSYLLALTAAVPVTGWAVDRFGGKRVWLFALTVFLAGSLLSGIAWSASSLIAFRTVQGLGGGMVAPVGMTLLAQAAGPERMGRAMSLVGVPMMLGPVVGPVLGGLLISSVSWQWIFLINLPVGAVVLLWSTRAIEHRPGRRGERLDVTGLLLLSPALVALVYGVSALSGDSVGADGLTGLVAGTVLLGLFVAHALRSERPLLDLRHFANRTFAAAGGIQFLTGAVLQGGMLLLPLFYQVVHGESPLATGLLLIPQGIGAALSMSVTGRLVDRGLGRPLVLVGLAVLTIGMLSYVRADASTSYVLLSASLFTAGIGTGFLMAPVSAAAYSVLDRAAIPRATSTLNITQRMGGVFGTALYAVILQHNLSAAGADQAAAFGSTFWWPTAIAAAAVLPALLLPSRKTNK